MTDLTVSDGLAEQLYERAETDGQSIEGILRDLLAAAEQRTSQTMDDRARQQQAVSEFGLQALSNLDLANMLDQALKIICKILDVSYVNMYEYQPDEHTLILKAGRGWKPGYVGTYRIAEDDNSLAMYALSANAPITVENLHEEARFRGADILHDHGIISSMAVIINGKNDPYGVLCAHTNEPRQFTRNEVHFFQAMANVLANSIERLNYESRIRYQAQLLEGTYDAIIATDARFRITVWNSAAEKLYGWWAKDAIGLTVDEVIKSELSADQWSEVLRQLEAVGFYTIKVTQYHRDGSPLYVEGKIIALRDNSDQITGFLAVNRDISERKQLRDKLQRHATQSEAGARISRLVSDVGLEYQAVLDVIVNEISDTIGDMCVITMLSDDRKWLVPAAYFHSDPNAMEHIQRIFSVRAQPVEGAVADIVEHARPIMLPEMNREDIDAVVAPDYRSYLEVSGMHGLMIVPLIVRGDVIGTLGVSRTRPGRPYTDNDLHFLQLLAAQVSLGVQNAKLHEEVRTGRDSLRLLMQEVVSAQEEERKRLSQELHDETGQALTALKIQLEQLSKSKDTRQLRHQVSGLIALTDDTIDYIRTLAQDLRPPALDMLGLSVAMEDYCKEFSKRTDYMVDFSADDIPPTPETINITLYRVLQEALTNVARHANATHVCVDLRYIDEEVILRIKDSGTGFDAATIQDKTRKSKSLGLIGMQERLEKVSGTLTIVSSPHTGTELVAQIPTGS